MSAVVVLSQFDSLVNKMESVSLKLCQKRIRPSTDQLTEFRGLYTRFKATLANFDAGIQGLLAIGYPDEEDIRLASRVRSAKNDTSFTPSTMTTLKRNLVLIFMGPTTFTFESKQVKTRNKQTETRCATLRSQHAHVILMWAMALQPSAWKASGGMTDKTFHFLIGDLHHERIEQIPPRIFETILSLAKEGPLKASGPFQTFIEKVSNPSGEQQSSLKRRRIEETPMDSTGFEATDEGGPEGTLATESREIHHSHKNNSTAIQQNRREIP